MYYSFYGFSIKPFEIIPDARFLYLSETHKEALSALVYGFEESHTLLMLTGDVGTGKTTVITSFLNSLDKSIKVLLIDNPRLSVGDFFYVLARGFQIAGDTISKARVIEHIEALSRGGVSSGQPLLLIIDEAQTVSSELLEELRLLSNSGPAALQIFLAGQLELHERLSQKEFTSLYQRIGMRCALRPMDRSETEDYIVHRLRVARCAQFRSIFKKDAIDVIFNYTNGIPRVINALCDQVLIVGYAENVRQISERLVRQTIQEVDPAGIRKLRDMKRSFFLDLLPKFLRHSSTTARAITALFIIFIIIALFFMENRGEYGDIAVSSKPSSSPYPSAVTKDMNIVTVDSNNKSDAAASSSKSPVVPMQKDKSAQSGEPDKSSNPVVEKVTETNVKQFTEPAQEPTDLSSPEKAATHQARLQNSHPDIAGATPEMEIITVKDGDNVSKIMASYYGRYSDYLFEKVAACNPHIKNLNDIHPGQQLNFPKKNPGRSPENE